MTFAEAYHEWMAESMSTLFNDGKLYDKLLTLKKRDNALFNYLKKFIDRIARLARKHYGRLLAETPEAQFVQGLSMDAIESLQQKFAEALVEAGQNHQKAEVQKDTAVVGGGQMQVRENTDIPYLQYRKLLNKKPLKDSGKYYGKVNGARIDKYRNLAEENIPDIDFFEIAEYNKVDEGYVYTVRNYNKLDFDILGRKAIRTRYDGYVMEVSTDGKPGEEIGNRDDVKGAQHQRHETSDRLSGNQGALRGNAEGGFETENTDQGRGVSYSDIDSGPGIKASQNSDRYQDRETSNLSRREAFAQVLDSVAADGADRLTIQRYREAAKAMDEQERKLNEINAQIREITHGSGKQDTTKLRELRMEASKARNRAKLYEDKLAAVEKSQPYQKMMGVIKETGAVNAVGAAAAGFDTLSSMEYEYGNLPEGENAVRDDTLPKSTNGKDKVSLTARTVKGVPKE